MDPADLLASIDPTIDPATPTRATTVIEDAWGLVDGVAVVPDDTEAGDMFLVSLQISMQLHRPARGTWLGIDSTGFAAADGTASGLVSLWSTDGELVATITQTALIRRV